MSYVGGKPGETLTRDQIYALAVKHGFQPGQEASLATAVAMAESGGVVNNFNPTDPHGGSVGLMQINGANAPLLGGGDWRTSGTSPDASMAAAHQLFARRGNFNDWGAYTSGAYKKFAGGATPPHTLTPATAGPAYTPAAVAAANPVPAAPPPPTFGESMAKGDVGGALKALATRPPPKTDDKGNPVEQKSTLENVADAFGSKGGGEQKGPAPIPEMQPMAPVQDPTPGLAPAAQQLWSTVAQAAARPLSWTSDPYGANAGLQRIRQGGGTTLNNTGYGYS